MGLFGKRSAEKEKQALIRTIKKSDRGKKQEKELLRDMMASGDPEVLDKIARARIQAYSRAAYEGDEEAQYWLGVSQAKLGNKEVSLEWLTGLAQKGDVRAMKAIARGYGPNGIYGYSRQEYRHWLGKAAEAGDARSQAQLGAFYAGKDEKQSRYWYRRSAAQDCAGGCIGLGKACYNEALRSFGEEGMARRQEMFAGAEKCFLRAADTASGDREFAEACRELGNLYESMAGLEEGSDCAERSAFFYGRAWEAQKGEEDRLAFERVKERFRLQRQLQELDEWEKLLFGNGGGSEQRSKLQPES